MSKTKNIIIMGPQGSGKGTQAEILSEKFNLPHVNTGDILRKRHAIKDELGKKIADIINKGNLLPNEITNEIMEERLVMDDLNNGFILDGYPRNMNQAETLDKIKDIGLVLDVWISDEEAISRLSQRRTCPKCGDVYNLQFKPPKVKGLCDDCNEKLIIREDDTEDAIKKRLSLYHKETEPLIDYYKAKGIYKKVDGRPAINKVTKSIMKIL